MHPISSADVSSLWSDSKVELASIEDDEYHLILQNSEGRSCASEMTKLIDDHPGRNHPHVPKAATEASNVLQSLTKVGGWAEPRHEDTKPALKGDRLKYLERRLEFGLTGRWVRKAGSALGELDTIGDSPMIRTIRA